VKVNFNHATKDHIVTLDEAEAKRLVAVLAKTLKVSVDPEADTNAQLDDVLNEVWS